VAKIVAKVATKFRSKPKCHLLWLFVNCFKSNFTAELVATSPIVCNGIHINQVHIWMNTQIYLHAHINIYMRVYIITWICVLFAYTND
jgi:hypothetical protein